MRAFRAGWLLVLRDRLFWWALLFGGIATIVWGVITNGPDGISVKLEFPWRQLLWAVVVLPIVEELAFRGLIQEFLAARTPRKIGPVSVANIVTSLLFSAAHYHFGLLGAAARFFPSLVFGYFRDRHNALLSPVILHIAYNAFAVVLV